MIRSDAFIREAIKNRTAEPPVLGSREFAMEAIKENYFKIIGLTGKVYMTSTEVLDALHSLGIVYFQNGRKLTKSNAIGDILGKHGLHLPMKMVDGKKHFFVGAIVMSAEALKEFEGMNDEQKTERVESVIVDVQKICAAYQLIDEE